MTTRERTIAKVELCETILKKCKGYGTNEQPLTIGVFKSIIEEVLNEQEKTLELWQN